jgi:hypothetical protein
MASAKCFDGLAVTITVSEAEDLEAFLAGCEGPFPAGVIAILAALKEAV